MTDLSELRLNSVETSQNIFPIYDRLRALNGTVWSNVHNAWLVSKFDSVCKVLTHPAASVEKLRPFALRTSDETLDRSAPMLEVMRHWVPFLDPPAHTRLRRIIQKSFMPRTVQGHEALVRRVTRGALDSIAGRHEIEFMEDFAAQIPALVITELFELPSNHVPLIRKWSVGIADFVLGSPNSDRHATTASVLEEMRLYLTEMVNERTLSGKLGNSNSLIGQLFQARQGPDAITNEEIVATLSLFLFAAPETTANMILNGMLTLVTHQDSLARLRSNPQQLPAAVEELIRYDGPVPVVTRVAKESMELDGQHIKPGDRIFAILKSANRDDEQFAKADQFSLDRGRISHVGFGSGIHTCVGASLARLEATVAFEEFLSRYSSIELADTKLEWRPELMAHSPKELRLRLRE